MNSLVLWYPVSTKKYFFGYHFSGSFLYITKYSIATSRRLPLRDAIERRPAPDDTIEDFDEPLDENISQTDQSQVYYQAPAAVPQTPTYQVIQPVAGYPGAFGFPFFRQYSTPQNYYIETRRTWYSPLQYFRGLVEGGRRGKGLFYPSSPFFKVYADLPGKRHHFRRQ